jgi:hypothetical protein
MARRIARQRPRSRCGSAPLSLTRGPVGRGACLLKLEHGVDVAADDREGVGGTARRPRLHGVVTTLGVASEHLVDILGPERGVSAARSRTDLDDPRLTGGCRLDHDARDRTRNPVSAERKEPALTRPGRRREPRRMPSSHESCSICARVRSPKRDQRNTIESVRTQGSRVRRPTSGRHRRPRDRAGSRAFAGAGMLGGGCSSDSPSPPGRL